MYVKKEIIFMATIKIKKSYEKRKKELKKYVILYKNKPTFEYPGADRVI